MPNNINKINKIILYLMKRNRKHLNVSRNDFVYTNTTGNNNQMQILIIIIVIMLVAVNIQKLKIICNYT